MLTKKKFAEKIVGWYELHKRDLPWRRTRAPYPIWLSEIILQQTRVAQGLPYYEKFLQKFPDLASLAAAREGDILRTWQGLGYYTRARNMHRCAKLLMRDYGGKFPEHYTDLIKLPGIGAYTAAAIASISFRQPVAVVDGNVYRVLARVFGKEEDIGTTKGKQSFFAFAQALVPADSPDRFNQAMMEFGALHCLPKNPKCEDCIFEHECVANAREWQDRLPVNEKETKVSSRYFTYFVFEAGKKLGMKKRTATDIWKGLFDFYLVDARRAQSLEKILQSDKVLLRMKKQISIRAVSPLYQHTLSHQKLTARFVSMVIRNEKEADDLFKNLGVRFYSMKRINQLPKPVLISRFLKDNFSS